MKMKYMSTEELGRYVDDSVKNYLKEHLKVNLEIEKQFGGNSIFKVDLLLDNEVISHTERSLFNLF